MRKQAGSSLLRLIRDNRRYWPGLIWLTVLMLLSGLFKSYSATFFGKMVDLGLAGDTAQVIHNGLLVLAMVLGDAVRLVIFNAETARTVERMFLAIKQRVFDVVAHCQKSAYDTGIQGGDVLSRVTSDLPTLALRFSNSFTWLISVFLRGSIALIFCLRVSWQLSLAYLLTLPLLLFVMNWIGRPIQAVQRKAAQHNGRAYSVMNEMLSNNHAVKAFGAEEKMDARFAAEVDAQCEQLNSAARKGMKLTFAAYLSDVLLMAVVFLYGGWLIISGSMTVGTFVTFVTLSGAIREMFELLDKGMSTMREGEALASRVYELLDLPQETQAQAAQRPASQVQPEDCVHMRGLSFAYTEGQPVLHDVHLRIQKGQRVGLIGPSGCGKSTLIGLICRFYDSFEGEMTLFGQPAGSSPPQETRRRIAQVSQNPYLFQGTIAENVRYGNPEADDARVEQALRDAQLWDFVTSLKDGADTLVGDDGSRLSGGQRQRIAIARALVRDAELVILDEAASALDTQTEREIQRTMDRAFAGKSVLVIAHRFASLSSVEYVYCMENGRIVEEGDVSELLARNSVLHRMAVTQSMAGEGDLV